MVTVVASAENGDHRRITDDRGVEEGSEIEAVPLIRPLLSTWFDRRHALCALLRKLERDSDRRTGQRGGQVQSCFLGWWWWRIMRRTESWRLTLPEEAAGLGEVLRGGEGNVLLHAPAIHHR